MKIARGERSQSVPADRTPAVEDRSRPRGREGIVLLLLVVLVGAVFGRSYRFDFIKYDETQQVVENLDIRSLKPAAIWHTFTDFSHRSYYPVRQLSFAIDYAFWKLRPAGYHLTNTILHGLSVCLLYLLLLRMLRDHGQGGSRSTIAAGFGAALFAVHPVVVEPVTWVAGREELLMVLFGLLCLHAHDRARRLRDQRLQQGRQAASISAWRVWGWQALAWLCFVLSCLSNAVGAIIPALLLMYDLVIGRVRSIRRLLAAHGPMWLLALGAVLLKMSHHNIRVPGDRLPTLVDMKISERLYTVLGLYAYNCRTVLWPRGLILVYPNLLVQSLFAFCTFLGILLVGLTLLALWRSRKQPMALAGLLWFLLALAPSSQILPHHIFRADRFLYLPMAGLACVAAAGAAAALSQPRWAMRGVVAPTVILTVLTVVTWRQVGHWQDTITLFTHCIRYNSIEAQNYNVRAIAYSELGRYDLALPDLDRAVELLPGDAGYRVNRARAYAGLGRSQEAIGEYDRAIALQSTDAEAFNQRAIVFLKEKQYDRAIQDFGQAVALKMQDASAYFNRANAYMELARVDEAIADYTQALKLQPEHIEALNNRGAAYLKQQKVDLAMADFKKAIELNADYVRAHVNLGAVYARQNRYEEAINCFDRALFLQPDDAEALLDRARAYVRDHRPERAGADLERLVKLEPANATACKEWGVVCEMLKAFDQALELFTRSIQIAPTDIECYNYRGILLAERGDLDGAIRDFSKAIELKPLDPSGYANRGIAHVRRGAIEQARQDWQRVIDLDSTGQLAAKARHSLESLGAASRADEGVPGKTLGH